MPSASANFIRKPGFRIFSFLLTINLMVLSLILFFAHASLHQHQKQAEINSGNLARLVSQSVERDITLLDFHLQAITAEVQSHKLLVSFDPARLKNLLNQHLQQLPFIDALWIADAEGNLLGLPESGFGEINIADRDYFQEMKTGPGTALTISHPIVARTNGKPVLVFARPLREARGGFAGTVFGVITIEWFSREFSNLQIGSAGAVIMRGIQDRDFELMARYPDLGYLGKTKLSQPFLSAYAQNHREGSFRVHATTDDILRIYSYRAIGDYPLIIQLGLAESDFLADWRREVIKLVVLGLAFLAATSSGGLMLMRAWNRLAARTAELERSNSDLEQFAYVASHDLQSPLRNIASFAQLLLRRYKGKLDDDADEFIAQVVGNAERMSAMIRDLLDYSRVTSRTDMDKMADLDQVIREVLPRFEADLQRLNMQVEIGPLPKVRAEPVWMESLFQNLIENAIRYRHPDRRPSIAIAACSDEEGWWTISVTDNGIGIDPAYHDKIFKMFYRLDPVRYPEGTGIGLAICRRMVKRFGGRMWVSSREGEGACFLFTLRAAD